MTFVLMRRLVGVSDVDKMHEDRGKPIREGKDIVDGNFNTVFDPEAPRMACALIIQTSGLVAKHVLHHLQRPKFLSD